TLKTTAQYTDTKLFSRIAAGDEEAFAILFHRYTSQLFPFLVSIVKSEVDAREILQETFLKCWLNRAKLGGIDNPGAWLNTIAAHSAYNYLRSRARYEKHLGNLAPMEPETEELVHVLDVRYAQQAIAQAVAQLPPKRRQIFELSRNEGLTRRQIAERLQLSENTVRNQLVESLRFLQDYLRKNSDLSIPFVLLILQSI
ncbi:MAG: sigma-70 family RNA polymerase sigma factor, partial [Bacteroidetes bacterium]|nr:sigma-70 family RNA polymerase sigma factor [Bacteroidota bacterium]